MIQFIKDSALIERNIPFGVVEVRYPEQDQLQTAAFYRLLDEELCALREKYPVMMQF